MGTPACRTTVTASLKSKQLSSTHARLASPATSGEASLAVGKVAVAAVSLYTIDLLIVPQLQRNYLQCSNIVLNITHPSDCHTLP